MKKTVTILLLMLLLNMVSNAQGTETIPQFNTTEEKQAWYDRQQQNQDNVQNQPGLGTTPATDKQATSVDVFDQRAEFNEENERNEASASSNHFVYVNLTVVKSFKADAKLNDKLHSANIEFSMDLGNENDLRTYMSEVAAKQLITTQEAMKGFSDETSLLNYFLLNSISVEEKNILTMDNAIITIYLMKYDYSEFM